MNPSRTGTIWLIVAILIGFGIELATNSVGDEAALLKLGALPDTGQLHGEFWRIATYSFLHYNWLHLLLNVGLLWWIGRIVESQVGTGRGALIYFVSVLYSAGVILFVHNWHPKAGATIGASGGIFGLLGAALIILYREDSGERFRKWLWLTVAVGFGVSVLPNISMAGHIGGILGGASAALLIKIRRNEDR
jgi:membrane associated rhomboid family serine protease